MAQKLVRLLMVTLLGVSVAGIAAATPVVAQPQKHEAAASCVNRESRDPNHFEIQFCGGAEISDSCNPGESGNISEPLFALNGCNFGVELYPLPNEIGTPTLCVSANSSTGAIKTDWQSYRIGAC